MSSAQTQMSSSNPDWWKTATFYQIYPRSFKDTTGSGIGDLAGVTRELDYLKRLGVDAIWLSPFYPSPQVDAGYDVSDYCDVDPVFGTRSDFDELLTQAHSRDIHILIDLVPNHCSDQHPLFQAALAAGPGNGERDLFHFQDGKGETGELPPNNWTSAFGGTSWTRVTEPDGTPGQWYYHLFASEQPDFNWANPQVTEFFEDVLRFWMDRGVDGFRIDVADGLDKETSWPDSETGSPVIWKDEDSMVHDVYRHFRTVMDDYPGTMAVLETGAEDHEVALFIRPDEMHQAFNFRFLKAPWGAGPMTTAITESLAAHEGVGATTTWVIDNHDNTRSATRYVWAKELDGAYIPDGADLSPLSDEEAQLGVDRVRAITLLYLSLPGSAYIYAGQELGLPEVTDIPEDKIQDPIFERTNGEGRVRDGCRVPLPWSGKTAPFGFSPDGAEETWLPQPSDWERLTVEYEDSDRDSMLNLYREMLRLRATEPALGTGHIKEIQSAEDAESTGTIRVTLAGSAPESDLQVIVNFGPDDLELPEGEVLLSSSPLEAEKLAADSAAILRRS